MDNKERFLEVGEVDLIFRYPAGRTKRLIRKGLIPAVQLPDGSIRVRESVVETLLQKVVASEGQVAHAV